MPRAKYKVKNALSLRGVGSTPILHDTLCGLKINTKCHGGGLERPRDPGAVCRAGETAAGSAPARTAERCGVRALAGREAAMAKG